MGQGTGGGRLMVNEPSRSILARDRLVADFETYAANSSHRFPAWLGELRRAGIGRFSETGFPSTSDERWRFTNFARLFDTEYSAWNGTKSPESALALEEGVIGWLGRTRVVFVDGRYSAKLSAIGTRPDGVFIGDLESAIREQIPGVKQNLARVADFTGNPFAALNTAFMSDGCVLIVPDGTALGEPIQILFLTTDNSPSTVSFPRVLVVVGQDAQATVVQMYVGVGDAASWSDSVTEVLLGDAAQLKMHRVQLEGQNMFRTDATHCVQGRDSSYSLTTLEFGGALSRHDIHVGLNGQGASCVLNGLVHLGGRQHVDNHTCIEHAQPHCTSRENFNGIFGGNSHGVFTGRILVREGAQQTDARQSSRNLLLSEEARADAQPQLEIFSDDVKCTHGATIGPIDEEAIFYIRSKGLTPEAARAMLTYGFAAEIVNSIGVDGLREWVDTLLRGRLDGNATNRLEGVRG